MDIHVNKDTTVSALMAKLAAKFCRSESAESAKEEKAEHRAGGEPTDRVGLLERLAKKRKAKKDKDEAGEAKAEEAAEHRGEEGAEPAEKKAAKKKNKHRHSRIGDVLLGGVPGALVGMETGNRLANYAKLPGWMELLTGVPGAILGSRGGELAAKKIREGLESEKKASILLEKLSAKGRKG